MECSLFDHLVGDPQQPQRHFKTGLPQKASKIKAFRDISGKFGLPQRSPCLT
jgi:hypothetical protein